MSSGCEILKVHGSLLDMHAENCWLDLKGKKGIKRFSINCKSLIFIQILMLKQEISNIYLNHACIPKIHAIITLFGEQLTTL